MNVICWSWSSSASRTHTNNSTLRLLWLLGWSALWLTVSWVPSVNPLITEVSIGNSNSNGFSLGELSSLQTILLSLVFLKLVALTTIGVLPIDVDLGLVWSSWVYLFKFAILRRSDEEDEAAYYSRSFGSLGEFNASHQLPPADKLTGSTFLLDCPMQYICEVDTWAQRDDHEGFMESMLARWFRSEKPWLREEPKSFGGMGSCREMYPCPFDVQEMAGVRIPGSATHTDSTTDGDADDVDNLLPYSV